MKPGVRKNLSHADYLEAPGLSRSILKHMARSPAHFKFALENPEPPTDAQILGEIIDLAILEPSKLEKAYWLRPETYENKKGEVKKWNGNATECKDWLGAHEDRHVIRVHEQEMVIAVRKAVLEHPSAKAALKDGDRKVCLFVKDPDTGILLKCEIDLLSGNAIVDLKSTDDASVDGFARSVAKFGYDVQAAFYLDICNWLGLGKEFFVFIAVEKEPPYAVAVYELDEESIQVGRSKYRRWLNLFNYCSEMNEWPAYPDDIIRLSLPMWAKRQEETLSLSYTERPMLVG